jgi:hypothetical protein
MTRTELAALAVPLFVLAMNGTALAGNSSYKCFESDRQSALFQKRLQYGVIITAQARATASRPAHGYDSVEKVKVTLLSRDPRKGGAYGVDRPEFDSVAKSEDVLYVVNSWRKNGVSLTIYLDEMDQSSLTLRGIRNPIQLICR